MEVTRYLAKNDLFYLLSQVLHRPDIEHPWLFDRCREVQNEPNGRLDLWAREHYKSTIITFGLTIQDILRDPEDTFGIFSHTRPAAKAFLRQIKREFEANEDLKGLFPEILWADPRNEAPKWSEDEGIIVKRKGNPKEATIEAWGLVDGQPTGKHFKKLNYDDVVTRESVTTPEMIQKTTEALELSYALGADGGERRFIGTRYHFNDTYKTVMDRGTAKPRIYACMDEAGEGVLLDDATLAAKRRDMGPYTFGTQMMLNPKGDETQGFRREWIKYYTDVNAGKGMNKYLLVDPASSKKKTSDYTVAFVVGLGPDDNYYVLDVVRDRLKLTQRADLVMRLHRKWKPIETRYEEYGLQADIAHIESVMEREQYRFVIEKVAGKTAKLDRIKRLIPIFEQGRMWLPHTLHATDYQGQTLDLIHDFIEEEYTAFPVPIHDDMLDALARIEEPDLTLKWPAKKSEAPLLPVPQTLNPGVGL